MIAKGTTHNNGGRLAAYMTTAKEGERAELWQLRGFEATTIKDAFRDVHIMAEATKCQQPFFHLQLRNREGETLTREQWEVAADRIERMLGLTGQPRAIAFHTFEHNNDEHMHVAWSRIDEDKLIAKPLPFFKQRLKNICRELELHFALEPVTNQREGEIKYAPKRAEHEQARRLGLDIHDIRNTIRACFDRCDCGTSFRAALDQEGLTLSQGERRDFVVIDQAGGIHALGKRILGVTAATIRERLSDLPREQLPTIEMAREATLARELTEVQKAIEAEQQIAPILWDRDQADQRWQDAVIHAAIEKEKSEQEFVATGIAQNNRDKEYVEQQEHTSAPGERIGTATHIRDARRRSDNARAFMAALAEQGIGLAQATKSDAVQSQLESVEAKMDGRWKPTTREGEIVAVTEQGQVWKLTARTTGDKDERDIQNFLTGLHGALPSVLDALHQQQRERDWEELRPRGRQAFAPVRQGMVQQQEWAMDRVKAADEFRRREEGRRAEDEARKTPAEIDPQRYLTDPEYRRQIKSERAYQTPQERKTDRENALRAMMEQQDRQR